MEGRDTEQETEEGKGGEVEVRGSGGEGIQSKSLRRGRRGSRGEGIQSRSLRRGRRGSGGEGIQSRSLRRGSGGRGSGGEVKWREGK